MFKYQYIEGSQIIEKYQRKISGIHTGRVNANILDNLIIEAYGSNLSIKEVATVTIPEPTQLLITPFDKGLISKIAKAITNSNLGVSPEDDGLTVRLRFPPMTTETRLERIKDLHRLKEEFRKQIRIERHDFLKRKKKEKEDSVISENEFNRFEDVLQREVDNLNEELDKMTLVKEAEIMKI
jgi:ribosome recycling factor